MRSKYFVILSLILFLFCIALYPILIDRVAIPDRVIDRSYQQFLLKASKPIKNKIIVASGSNSLYSIDALLMEKHYKRFVFISADNGDYPLEHKIYNFSNYVSSGDLIIFPLEFSYFAKSKKIATNYVEPILDKTGSLSFYYRELPYYKKLDFIYNHIPFILALKRIVIPNKFWRFNTMLSQDELDSINSLHSALNAQNRGESLLNNPLDLPIDSSETKTCDEYLFINNEMDDNFKVSEQFKDNLALLQNMSRETGAEVIFTWPAVVGKTGDECYTSVKVKDKIGKYTQKIVAEVNRHGFKFLGNIEDSKFDSSCFLNTYYHIKADCAVERTKRLIDLLETNGIKPATGYSIQETQKILNDYLTTAESPLLEKLSSPPLNVPIMLNHMAKNLIFSSGWGAIEFIGVWSIGNTSTILIPKLQKTVNSIRFKGTYFNGNEETGIWINDSFVGKYVLRDQVINVAGKLNNDSYNKIVFEHSNPISPSDIGMNDDTRKIKYAVYSIEFID